ncbi:MAG: hypothetical protein AAF725_17525 [Acidobacteriota bacterium]
MSKDDPLLRKTRHIARLAGFATLGCFFLARTLAHSPEHLELSRSLTELAYWLAAVTGAALLAPFILILGPLLVILRAILFSRASREGTAEVSAEEECLDHKSPPPAGPIEGRWIPLSLEAGSLAAFTTSQGEPLEAPAEGPAQSFYRLREPRHHEEELIHFVRVETRVRDAAGRWWSAHTYLDPSALTREVRPRRALEDSVDRVEAHYWRSAPEPWREAVLRGCLVRDVSDAIDSRERYRLRVGEEWAILLLKYQGPSLDVAWFEGRLLVRAKQMVLERWRVDPWSGGKASDRLDIIDNVSICFALEPGFLSLFEAPEQHFAKWGQCEKRFEEWSLEDRRPLFEPASQPR